MRKKNIPSIILIILYFVILYLPIYWLFITAFKERIDIVSPYPKFFFKPTLDNFKWIFSFSQVTDSIINSLIVTIGSVMLALMLGLPASYGISKFRFRGREGLRNWTLTVRMMPPVAVILPMYIIWRRLNLYDTYFSLIITYLAVSLPLIIWLMVGFFNQIPQEIEEAARIDGCGIYRTFLSIALPNAIPGIIVSAILSFIFIWNDMFFAFILTSIHSTFPVVITSMATTGLEVRWGEMAAMGVLSIIPALIFAIFTRNLLIRGFQGLYVGK
jgi:multiple sugar transport system permease protein